MGFFLVHPKGFFVVEGCKYPPKKIMQGKIAEKKICAHRKVKKKINAEGYATKKTIPAQEMDRKKKSSS